MFTSDSPSPHTFILQNVTFPQWAMLGSNQRPLPCEGSVAFSRAF
jgi:hypothetical protein